MIPGVVATVIFLVFSLLFFIRLVKKRKGMLNASASHTSEMAIQPFTTDATVDVAHLESRVSDLASDTLLETAPRIKKGLHHFFRREAVPLGINTSRTEKQRTNHDQGLARRASIQTSPTPRTAEASSSAVVPLPVVSEPDQEVRNSDSDLRREMEHLRRELERVKQAQEMTQEAPPLYEDERRVYV